MSASKRSAGHADLVEALKRRIPDSLFSISFERSSGPGGQNVNKVNTKATLSFNLTESPELSEWEKERVRAKLASRVSQDGILRVTSSRYRTQAANRRAAAERCYELLAEALRTAKPRRSTKPTAASRRRRMQAKRDRSLKKSMRRLRSDQE